MEKLSEEEHNKVKSLMQRMLNEKGTAELPKHGILKKLVNSLSIEDIHQIETGKIYFNVIYSPASKSDLSIALESGSQIITIGINTIKRFTSDEGTAIILHEIGHALNPTQKGLVGEFVADKYAVDRNYKDSILSSLIKGKSILPDLFATESTESRIAKLNETIVD